MCCERIAAFDERCGCEVAKRIVEIRLNHPVGGLIDSVRPAQQHVRTGDARVVILDVEVRKGELRKRVALSRAAVQGWLVKKSISTLENRAMGHYTTHYER